MKRTALKRKTPMKRGGKLKPRSKKQAGRMTDIKRVYEAVFSRHPHCVACVRRGVPAGFATEPHHPQGRVGENLFKFIPVCRECHHWIHHEPAAATKLGLLIPNR